jgi:hypothetical protein
VGAFAPGAEYGFGLEPVRPGSSTQTWKYGVLHFATHARVDDYSVRRTTLALSPGRTKTAF